MEYTITTTQASLELTTQNKRIKRYIFSILSQKEKEAEEYYKKKYNAFYKWSIGVIRENEIMEELSFYFKENMASKNVKAYNKFSQLVASYKSIAGTKEPKSLTQDEWFAIRENYERELKQEYETTINNISYNEKVGDSGNDDEVGTDALPEDNLKEEKKVNNDVSEENGPSVYKGSEEDEEAKVREMKIMENDILDGLDDHVYLGNWKIQFIGGGKKQYTYHLAIFNMMISKEVFDSALSFLKEQYPKGEFELKFYGDNGLIEGVLNTGI